jgi:hypothetical protein
MIAELPAQAEACGYEMVAYEWWYEGIIVGLGAGKEGFDELEPVLQTEPGGEFILR